MDKNRTTSEKNIGINQLKFGPYAGIYLGEITDTEDLDRSGRVRVKIPMLSGDVTNTDGMFTCTWSSPFAGSTPAASLGADIKSPLDTQKSYGLWMVPPDVGNTVLVCFGDGNLKHGIVIACLFQNKLTHMVPGMAAGLNYSDPSMLMPVYEKNRRDGNQTHNDAVRPIALDLAEAVTKQGLINDTVRGVGTSSSRRESPSQVYGFLTPGPKDPENPSHRLGGHQFVMDDSVDSRMVRIRTASGGQILMDDTSGVIYAITPSGSAWLEMTNSGSVHVYGETSINFRTQGNFNIRADQNVNIEAGQDVNIKAAGDNVAGEYKGLSTPGVQPLGTGGNIRFEAAADLTQLASLNLISTAFGGELALSAAGTLSYTGAEVQGLSTVGPMTMSSSLQTSILGGAGVNITSVGAPITEIAPTILMNSGGATALPARPAPTAPSIGTTDHLDAAKEPPEFDREAAIRGEPAAPSGGMRTGKQDSIGTIVSTMLTKEPFIGHQQYDPLTASTLSDVTSNPDVEAALPSGAVDLSGKPVDVQTPSGALQGSGYVDAAGNELDTAAQDAAKELKNATPQFNEIEGVVNDFTSAAQQELASLQSLTSLIDGISAAIPLIRFPTTNILGQKVIGLGKLLSEIEARLKQFALDAAGAELDLNSKSIDKMREAINEAKDAATDATGLSDALSGKGISVLEDGGGRIFEDESGNRIIDFSENIGPVGAVLAQAGEINKTWKNVRSAIRVPVNSNQSLALAHFSHSIGEEKFLNSNVLEALNRGEYHEVPRMMTTWNLGRVPGSNQVVSQGSLEDLRKFQASLFQNPDELQVDLSAFSQGESTFSTVAQVLDTSRQNFLGSRS